MEKAAKLFLEVLVAIADYTGKTTLFDLQERAELCRASLSHLPNVHVVTFSGLAVELAQKEKCSIMIRGMRAVSDIDYELSLALTNKKLSPENETIFLVPSLRYM